MDVLRLYLRPVDQMGRMHVTAGEMRVQAVELQAATPPRVVVERSISPQELDAAYRTGFTGDSYSIDLELPADLGDDLEELTVRVDLTETGTGHKVSAQSTFQLER